MAVKITTDDLLGNGNSTPWWQRAAQQAVQSIKLPNTDNSLSYGELRQFQAVGNTDSHTNQMAPNIVIPGKENPALTGMAPPQDGGKAPAQQAEPKLDSYDRMLEFLQANQIANADADKRARKRELMAAIGDGISAVSSLYQTTKGAPVTYTPGADMSEAMRQRYDRMTAQRKADSDKYLNYLRVQQAKEQRDEINQYRQDQLDERRRANEANEQLRREQIEARKMTEENTRAYRQARLDLMRAKDPGTVEFFKAKAAALAEGWPEDKANEAGQIAQENYNEAKKEADRQKKLADRKAIKAAPNPPKQSKSNKKSGKRSSSKKQSGSSGKGSLGHAPGNL